MTETLLSTTQDMAIHFPTTTEVRNITPNTSISMYASGTAPAYHPLSGRGTVAIPTNEHAQSIFLRNLVAAHKCDAERNSTERNRHVREEKLETFAIRCIRWAGYVPGRTVDRCLAGAPRSEAGGYMHRQRSLGLLLAILSIVAVCGVLGCSSDKGSDDAGSDSAGSDNAGSDNAGSGTAPEGETCANTTECPQGLACIQQACVTRPAGEDVSCPYPNHEDPTAVLEEGLAENAPQALSLGFADSGALLSIGGTSCTPELYDDYDPRTSTECYQAYRCDACLMIVGNRTLDTGLDWFLVPNWPKAGADFPVECNSFGGFYDICTPDCDGKVCGNDGCKGSCGACPGGQQCSEGSCRAVTDPCRECTSSCRGLPGCCSGCNCLCESECGQCRR